MPFKLVSKEQAFAPVDGETSIPIDYAQFNFQFTKRWFKTRNQKTWSTFLYPQFGGGQPVKMLQIGVFEAMDLVWCCQNLLQHPDSHVIGIDPWVATRKISAPKMEAVYERAKHNVTPWVGKVKLIRGFSGKELPKLPRDYFDLIVIDGDHNADAMYMDAVQSLTAAKTGAHLVFDDVRNRIDKKDHVAQGLEMFVNEYDDKVEFQWAHRYCDCFRVLEKVI